MKALRELKEFKLTAPETEVLYPSKTNTSWSYLYFFVLINGCLERIDN